jgi:hypothetical protein
METDTFKTNTLATVKKINMRLESNEVRALDAHTMLEQVVRDMPPPVGYLT